MKKLKLALASSTLLFALGLANAQVQNQGPVWKINGKVSTNTKFWTNLNGPISITMSGNSGTFQGIYDTSKGGYLNIFIPEKTGSKPLCNFKFETSSAGTTNITVSGVATGYSCSANPASGSGTNYTPTLIITKN